MQGRSLQLTNTVSRDIDPTSVIFLSHQLFAQRLLQTGSHAGSGLACSHGNNSSNFLQGDRLPGDKNIFIIHLNVVAHQLLAANRIDACLPNMNCVLSKLQSGACHGWKS
jgi:hypothetical protein